MDSRSLLFGTLAPVLAALLATIATAGDGESRFTPPTAIASRSHGIRELDGSLVGGGPRYRATFDADGFTFTPAFGSTAPRTWPLRFSLTSVAVESAGGVVPFSIAPASARLAEGAAEYERAAGVVERYVTSEDGVEQTFVFDSRPSIAGDLVVRGTVATELEKPPAGDHSAGVAFTAPGFGAVTIGGVTGIDAAGRTSPGTLSFDGSSVEYRIPADFVEHAAYPLVLDPFFMAEVVVATTNDEQSPDVAFDDSTGFYLVVWDTEFASGDHDIRGQVIDTLWNFVGGTVFIEAGSTVDSLRPRVGNMNITNTFLVTWTETTGFLTGVIRCRSVLPSFGLVSTKLSVGPTTGLNANPDIGCESQETYGRAVIVWQNFDTVAGSFRILAANVNAGTGGPFSADPYVAISSGFDDTAPAICSHDVNGLRMIVWKRDFGSGDSEIRGAVVDRDLNLVDSLVTITNNTSFEDDPAVDGDGYNFLVAYETQAVENSGDKDVVAARVRSVASGVYEVATPVMDLDLGVLDSQDPDVGWLSGSALVVWRQQMLTGKYRGVVASVDPIGPNGCENYFFLPSATSTTHRVRVGTSLNDFGMIVRHGEATTGGDGVVMGQQFLAEDGLQVPISGPCGAVAYASCARIGNASFKLHVSSVPAASAYLIVGTQGAFVPCGFCVLVVDPNSGLFLHGGTTDAKGELTLAAGIPNDPTLAGLKFSTQWIVVKPSATGNCPKLHAYLSNGVRTTLQ